MIWKPFCHNKNSTYLLMDEFSVHLMAECVKPIQDCGTEVDFVLAGYTSKLQVLDVGVNKPFKDYVKQCYERFMVQNVTGRKVSRLDVAKWIEEAWEKFVILSFLATIITLDVCILKSGVSLVRKNVHLGVQIYGGYRLTGFTVKVRMRAKGNGFCCTFNKFVRC